MKKIGIITFHRANNYGAVLQAYALMLACREFGDAVIIDYDDTYINSEYNTIRPLRKKQFIKSLIKTAMDCFCFRKRSKRRKAFDNFRNKYLATTKRIDDMNSLKIEAKEFDYVITGSDQVWSPVITDGISDIYFMSFASGNTKKISYAPSVGNAKQLKPFEEKVKELLSDYVAISVRESDAQEYISNLLKKDVEQVVDPVLLIEKETWKELLKDNDKKTDEKYIFAYSVSYSPECTKIANHLSTKEGMPIIHAEQIKKTYRNTLRTIVTEGPIGFINAIKNAEYVVTSSFHATVFSIIFHKKLIVIPHRKTGIRVVNLLSRCGIADRVYYTLEEFIERNNYANSPAWTLVDKRIDAMRKQSKIWLKSSLEKGDLLK